MKVYCYLKITSELIEPEELENLLGDGAETWRIGGFKPNTKMLAKVNGWQVKVVNSEAEDPSAELKAFLESVIQYEKVINKLGDKIKVMVSLIVYDGNTQGYYFEKSILERIIKLNADLNIDPYLI
jgi:hypothetical protein